MGPRIARIARIGGSGVGRSLGSLAAVRENGTLRDCESPFNGMLFLFLLVLPDSWDSCDSWFSLFRVSRRNTGPRIRAGS